MPIKDSFCLRSGKLPVASARVNNLQNASVDIPIGVLTVVT
jgi:excinuclease UvrABC ATPase subunit